MILIVRGKLIDSVLRICLILVKFAKRNIIFLRVFCITIGSNGRGLCRGPEFWSRSRSCFFLFFLLRGFFMTVFLEPRGIFYVTDLFSSHSARDYNSFSW